MHSVFASYGIYLYALSAQYVSRRGIDAELVGEEEERQREREKER